VILYLLVAVVSKDFLDAPILPLPIWQFAPGSWIENLLDQVSFQAYEQTFFLCLAARLTILLPTKVRTLPS
jgi:hypothetical protein